MRQRRIQVVLLTVVGLAVSLVGIPLLFRWPDSGVLRGVVVDARGFGVAGASVFVFQEQELRLVEESLTDEDGDFAFRLEDTGLRVFVRPPEASGLLPAWSEPDAEAENSIALVLPPARELGVRVLDAQGVPVPLAEVRVYGLHPEVALATARTDQDGRASLPAPAKTHVAVLAPREPRLMRWRFGLAVPERGSNLEVSLPDAERLSGVVLGPEGPLSDIVLVSREEGSPDGWNGFSSSDHQGRFELPRTAGPTRVHAQDPSGRYLPASVRTTSAGSLEIRLETGAPQLVRTTRNGLPLEAVVWSWSPAEEVWSWGERSSSSGRATVPVGERFSIRAEPLDPALAPLEAWDIRHGAETLQLEATTRR